MNAASNEYIGQRLRKAGDVIACASLPSGETAIRFKSGEFTDGIVEAITAAGHQLKTYFPRAEGDVNELSDEIDIEE